MDVSQAYNFKRIDDSVSTSGLLSEEQLSALGPEGYEAVINLLPDDSEYALPSERAIVQGQGIDYRYIPVDFSAPTDEDYTAFVQAMASSEGKRLHIHCAANYRVSAFYAIYAHQHLDWPRSRAMAHIESIWTPAEHPPWDAFVSNYLDD